jgi:hypothetical protein
MECVRHQQAGSPASQAENRAGVTLSAGESLQVDRMVAVSNVVPDGFFNEITLRRFVPTRGTAPFQLPHYRLGVTSY